MCLVGEDGTSESTVDVDCGTPKFICRPCCPSHVLPLFFPQTTIVTGARITKNMQRLPIQPPAPAIDRNTDATSAPQDHLVRMLAAGDFMGAGRMATAALTDSCRRFQQAAGPYMSLTSQALALPLKDTTRSFLNFLAADVAQRGEACLDVLEALGEIRDAAAYRSVCSVFQLDVPPSLSPPPPIVYVFLQSLQQMVSAQRSLTSAAGRTSTAGGSGDDDGTTAADCTLAGWLPVQLTVRGVAILWLHRHRREAAELAWTYGVESLLSLSADGSSAADGAAHLGSSTLDEVKRIIACAGAPEATNAKGCSSAGLLAAALRAWASCCRDSDTVAQKLSEIEGVARLHFPSDGVVWDALRAQLVASAPKHHAEGTPDGVVGTKDCGVAESPQRMQRAQRRAELLKSFSGAATAAEASAHPLTSNPSGSSGSPSRGNAGDSRIANAVAGQFSQAEPAAAAISPTGAVVVPPAGTTITRGTWSTRMTASVLDAMRRVSLWLGDDRPRTVLVVAALSLCLALLVRLWTAPRLSLAASRKPSLTL